MSMPPKPRTLKGLKSQAKKLKKETGCQHAKALEMVARLHGWSSYWVARRDLGDGA